MMEGISLAIPDGPTLVITVTSIIRFCVSAALKQLNMSGRKVLHSDLGWVSTRCGYATCTQVP